MLIAEQGRKPQRFLPCSFFAVSPTRRASVGAATPKYLPRRVWGRAISAKCLPRQILEHAPQNMRSIHRGSISTQDLDGKTDSFSRPIHRIKSNRESISDFIHRIISKIDSISKFIRYIGYKIDSVLYPIYCIEPPKDSMDGPIRRIDSKKESVSHSIHRIATKIDSI